MKKSNKEVLLFTLPCLIFIGLIFYAPFLSSLYYSLTKWNGIDADVVFIGLDNFKKIFTADSDFWKSLFFTLKYSVLFIILVNLVSLFLATMLVKKMKLANFLRSLFFVPYIMSLILVGFIWRFIFSQGFATLFEKTNLGVFNLSWLGAPNLAFISIVLVSVWQGLGFYLVLYIAGLQTIPDEIIEAASIDGASGVKRFIYVTLPMLKPTIYTCLFMSLINSIKVFDVIMALTNGGPGTSTTSITLNIYKEAFLNNNFGLGSAKSLLLFVLVIVLTQVITRLFNRQEK